MEDRPRQPSPLPEMVFSPDERAQRKEQLLVERKLVMVLDLDQTLVHAKQAELFFQGPEPVEDQVQRFMAKWKMEDPSERQELFAINIARGGTAAPPGEEEEQGLYLLKVRPGAREFLKAVAHDFVLHICSSGSRDYVTKAMCILDNSKDRRLVPNEHIYCREELQSSGSKARIRSLCVYGPEVHAARLCPTMQRSHAEEPSSWYLVLVPAERNDA